MLNIINMNIIKGKNVALEYEMGMPWITKDGVTVCKNIMLKEWGAELGSSLLRSVSHNINELAGDGTTTATILANSIIYEGLKYV